MQAQINLPDFITVDQYANLILMLDEIRNKLDRLLSRQFTGEWLNGTDFCKKYGISRPTLYKRIKGGLIDVQNLGDIKRYKIKEGV